MNSVVVTCDDGGRVALGDKVWINHSCNGSGGPEEVVLKGVRCDNGDWPYRISRIPGGVMDWAHIYSSRNEAVRANPMPEIEALRGRVKVLEQQLAKLKECCE